MKMRYKICVNKEDIAEFRDEALALYVFNEMLEVFSEGDMLIQLFDMDGRVINDNLISMNI